MSTEHQKYSTANQSAAIHAYAARRGMEIVRTYADEGKSGLTFHGRKALQQLMADVLSGAAGYRAIVVYDVSRWGRFQDVDEAGYYEYLCKRAGIRIHYCAEPFENDGNPFSTIVKSIKRAMAGEYSRELSTKVFAAHARLVKLGYSQGGAPSYGLRRLLLDQTGKVKFELRAGERKNLYTDRVVWTPGPAEEVDAVRRIFESFVRDKKSEREIARELNRRRIPAVNGRAWTRQSVRRVLRNERYIGNYVWNQVSTKLKTRQVCNAPGEWIRAEGVIEPIVPRELFAAARDIIRGRSRELTQEEKLEPLRRLLRERGRLASRIISENPGTPSVSSYERWFGSLSEAYKLIGYTAYRSYRPRRRPLRSRHAVTAKLSNDEFLELLRQLLQKHGFLSRRVIDEAEGVPSSGAYFKRFGSMARAYRLAGFPEHHEYRHDASLKSGPHAITFNLSDEQLLAALRRLLRKRGKLTRTIINKSGETPSSTTYFCRFGSMERVYKLVGYTPTPRPLRRKRRRPSTASTVGRKKRRSCGNGRSRA